MKLDRLLKDFVERYDEEAIASIEKFSSSPSMRLSRCTLEGFDIDRAIRDFNEYLSEYARYNIEFANSPKKSSHKAIMERTSLFIENDIIVAKDVQYSHIPSFIKRYVEGIQSIQQCEASTTNNLMEHDATIEEIGSVQKITEQFGTKLMESFYRIIDNVLIASGYAGKHQKSTPSSDSNIQNPVFL